MGELLAVELMLGVHGRSLMLVDALSVDGLVKASDVLELLNDDLRLLKLSILRTFEGRLIVRGDGDCSVGALKVFDSILSCSGLSLSISDDG